MRTHFSIALCSLSLLVLGCGGSSAAAGGGDAPPASDTGQGTSGGEVEAPRTLYTTTPVPVPQPGVSRDRLAEPTQSIWLEVEQAIAARPPEPPASGDEEVLRAWYGEAFTSWLAARVEAASRAESHASGLEGAAPWERGVAAGLLGYLHETTAAEARGGPIPPSISSDAELLAIYTQSLDQALLPLARRALEGYRFCLAAFQELEGASEASLWATWSEWCEDRGEDVFRVYSHAPAEGARSSDATPADGPASP